MSIPDVLALVASFGVTAWFIKLVVSKSRDDEQHAEDSAREFFDEHGHWPDETAADAAARAEAGAAAERQARAARAARRRSPQ